MSQWPYLAYIFCMDQTSYYKAALSIASCGLSVVGLNYLFL